MLTAAARMSSLYAPTLKEDPAEAELASHRLLLRAGMIRKSAAGIYSFLPLGQRSIAKIEQIAREEMNAIGSQEVMLPVVQPAELWVESGRWDDYGPELARFQDRHGREFCLGPTHEEIITALVRADVRSYRELPLSLYQVNIKFRDEVRPRFGLLRGREFIMKDAYSFHADQESLQEHYDAQAGAYGRICERLGLDYRPVVAESGQIGGKVTTEFMALADAGEAELVYCDCGWAANVDAAEADIKLAQTFTTPAPLEKVSTPGIGSISALAEFLSVEPGATIKTMVAKTSQGRLVFFLIPGDRALNTTKAEALIPDGMAMLEESDFAAYSLPKGFLGPVGAPDGTLIVADRSLKATLRWTVGANERDFHLLNAMPGRDFGVDVWADVISARPGDTCPACGEMLKGARGIEVSQVFQLGTKYSESMGATYLDENGEEQHFLMGCYGVGISRSLAAIIEQHNDDSGIIWPVSVAPYEVAVIALASDGEVYDAAESIWHALTDAGIEAVFDDRDERAGVKFADADLIGWPYQVIVGRKGLAQQVVELKPRSTGERVNVPLAEIVPDVARLVEAERHRLG